MNIYEKIQQAKVKLLEMDIKKSGNNKFAGFSYYELSDFVPAVIRIFDEVKLYSKFTFTIDEAKLIIRNMDKIDEVEEYTSPMVPLEIKGANALQALGGAETYQRRYLYMAALDIIEQDSFDANCGKPQEPAKQQTPPPKTNKKTTEADEHPPYRDEDIPPKVDESTGEIITPQLICDECEAPVTEKVAKYSTEKLGRCLCFNCQKAN